MTSDDKAQDRRLANHVVAGGRLRALVLELWQRTRIDWGFVTDRLSATFRKERWIGAQERRFVAETLYGLVRHLRRVDAAIAAGSRRAGAPRDLDRLVAYLVLEGSLAVADAARAEPAIDWAKARAIDDAIAGERDRVKRIALGCSLPDWLAARVVADWGDDAEPLARALNQRAPMTVRANLAKLDRAGAIAALAAEGIAATPGPWSPTAVIIAPGSRTNLFATQAFQRGELEAQDEGSQLLAELATPKTTKATVLDLCAGAGGKTLAIAAAMSNRGRIVATDVDGKKLEELRRRARRAGITTIQAATITGVHDRPPPLAAVAGKADVVLVDAPCSGLGALRRNPEARWRLRESDLTDFARRQREILRAALDLAAPGGLVIYATCTILREENQDVVAATLSACSSAAAIPLSAHLDRERAAALGDGDHLIVTPHRHGTDGFFAAVLRRTG
jgi:16S rRNA (cytosine967-C5)-methyltransferase